MEERDGIQVNAHSSIRLVCKDADDRDVVLYCDPFLIDADHGVAQPPHDADVVLFTHSHYDHFSPKDYEQVAKEDTVYFMPSSMTADAVKAGVPANAITAIYAGETLDMQGIPVLAVPAYNIGKHFHSKARGWVGYVVRQNDDTSVYICGDTDITPEALAVPCDIIMLPVGGTYTMNPAEAAQLVREKRAKQPGLRLAIPTHYGSVVGTPDDGRDFAAQVGDTLPVWLPLG